MLAAVDSVQQLGSGFWAHPAVADAGLHAMAAGFPAGTAQAVLLPATLGCHTASQELRGERLRGYILIYRCTQLCYDAASGQPSQAYWP